MSSTVYLIIAVLSSASMAIVLKIFRKQKGNRYGIILGNYLTCVLLSFLLMPEKQALLSPDAITLLCGIVAGLLFVAGLVSMQSSIAVNGAILTSAFSKLGLIVPLLISTIFFGDRIRILSGFLKDYEGCVTRVNRKKRTVEVCVDFQDKKVSMQLGYELVSAVKDEG